MEKSKTVKTFQKRESFSGRVGYVLAMAGSAVGLVRIDEEVELSSNFKRKHLYHFFMQYMAPACIAIILLSSIANAAGWISL